MKRITVILVSILLIAAVSFTAMAEISSDANYKTEITLKAGQTADIVTNADIESLTSSDESVATVKDGEITALTKGSAIITATLKNGETEQHKVIVTTNPKIVGTKKKAEKFSTFPIDVKGAATKIKYSSSKPKIASITSEGYITTKKVGTTTIKAKVNGTTLSFKLKVYIKDIVNHYKTTFKKGYTYSLYYSEVGKTPKIVSDNPKVVKVTKSGKLKAKKRGSATVTFSHKHAKAIVKIKVV